MRRWECRQSARDGSAIGVCRFPRANPVFRRNLLQIPKCHRSLHPSSDHLPDPPGGHSIAARELFARPSLYKIERRDAPLNVGAILPGKHRNLRGKAHTAIPDCQPDATETFARYAAFRSIVRVTYHTRRLDMSYEKVMKPAC